VTLSRSEGPVVVHLLLPGEEEEVKPLVPRGEGRWGVLIELRRADWQVVFEDVATGEISSELSLTELGLDRALLAEPAGGEEMEQSDAPSVIPSLLLAAAAAIVTGAAIWTAGRNRLR
jgi:hypothetical protein